MSYSYQKFIEDIKYAFEALIIKHKLSVENRDDYFVELSNKYVEITFSFERGDLYSELTRKNDDYTFSIYQIYKHLLGNKAEDNYQNSKIGIKQLGYPKTDLVWFAKLFENELSPILAGNFDWYKVLKAEKEYEKQLVAIVLGAHISHSNPIRQKFWVGDPSWRKDVEDFIKEKKIELKPVNNCTI